MKRKTALAMSAVARMAAIIILAMTATKREGLGDLDAISIDSNLSLVGVGLMFQLMIY